MEPFEYAVRKDVRNNPIVREVDEARQRELWKSVGIAGLLVVALLFSAWQHFELLRHGYQVEEIQRERATEEEAARQLRARCPRHVLALTGPSSGGGSTCSVSRSAQSSSRAS